MTSILCGLITVDFVFLLFFALDLLKFLFFIFLAVVFAIVGFL